MTTQELNTLEALLKKAKAEDQLRVYSEEDCTCWVEYIYADNNTLFIEVKNNW